MHIILYKLNCARYLSIKRRVQISWGKNMKAVGILGSPHKDGNTAYLLKETLKVLEKELETETIFLKDYRIRPCEGCFSCEENGKCVIEDDMQKLYPKLEKADVIILASPSYMGGVTSRMRTFMERTWHLRKGQLKNIIGTSIVVGRRDTGSTKNAMNSYLDKLKVVRVPGCSGFAFKKGEIIKDREAIKEARRVGERILGLLEKGRAEPMIK